MKKRLICMLLTVLMVVSLFAGAGVSASAETVSYSTMTYRMASGDYVLRICQRLDLNYYVCKPAIMKLNNIQEGQWNKLPVGKLLTLPATDADAVVIATGHGSTATTQTATTANTTAAATLAATTPSSSAKTSASASGDVIWWWIVPYQLRSGETIADAMNSLGVSASAYWDTIQKINKIKDWGSSRTDTSILLPTVYPPADGFSRVTIYAHRMLASETPANVVTARGLDYNKIKPMLDILNEKYGGVANVQTGERLFYPIASNGKVYGKDRVDGQYSLFSGLSSENGTVEFYVNGERVYQAKAGATVSYVIKPAKGKAVKDIVLKLSNGQGDMYLNGSSFVMPASDVTLDAGFQSGHKIALQSNYEGKAAVRVDGVGVDNAAKGAKVMVVSTDASLAVDELYINYTTLTGAKREQVTNIDQGFVMPDYDVTVEVFLKPVPTYSLFVLDNNDQRVPMLLRPINTNGSFSLEVEGAKVTKAARGAEVKIVPEADNGFTVGQIWVFRHNTNVQIGVFNNTFVMPNVEVDVGVLFVPKGNNIRINPVEGGQFYATIGAADANPSTIALRDANAVDEAGTNVRVFLNWVPDPNQPGFAMSNNPDDFVVTRNNGGLRVPVTMVDGAPSFRMPAGGATVTGGVVAGAQTYTARVYLDGVQIPNGQFKGVSLYTKGDNAAERSEYQDGSGRTTAGQANVQTSVGEYITLSYEGGKKITPVSFEVWDVAEANKLAEESDQAQKSGCFKMPNQPVVIRAYFVSDTVKLENADVKVTGSGTVGMLGLNAAGTAWNSVEGVKVGEPFAISLSPSEGFFFNNGAADGKARLLVKRKDNGGTIASLAVNDALIDLFNNTDAGNPRAARDADGNLTGEFAWFFGSMPDCGVTVEVIFDEIDYVLQLRAEDETGAALNAGGFWKVRINGKDNVVENNTSTLNAHLNDTISLAFTEAGESKFVFVRSIINNVASTGTQFTISGELSRTPGRVIPVTVVLRQISQNNSGNPFALRPFSNARGNTGFMIMNSPSHPATVTGKFATEAYAGDTVAIFPTPVTPAEYYTDGDHIRVCLTSADDNNFIVPTPVDADNDGTVDYYTFVMPENGYDHLSVDFLPVKYTLTINKRPDVNAGDPFTAANGLFKVWYENDQNHDVLSSTSFMDAPFDSKIWVELTDAGRAANLKINITDSVASIAPTVGTNWDTWSNGFWFKMPAGNTSLTVILNDENDGFTDVPKAPENPVAKPIQMPTATEGTPALNLQYSYEDGTVITDGKPNTGETVKVEITTALDPGEMIKEPGIQIKDKDGVVVATVADGGTFEVPDAEGPLTAHVTIVKKQYKVRIGVKNAPDTYTINVDGNTVTAGQALTPNKEYETNMTIAVTGARNIKSVDNLNGWPTTPAKTGTGKLKPDASVENGATVDVVINFEVPTFGLTKVSKEDYTLTYYTDAAMTTEVDDPANVDEGTSVYVKATGGAIGSDRYADTVTIKSEALTKQSSGAFGPYTVTSDVAKDDALVTTAEKKVTVQVEFVYENGTSADARGTVWCPAELPGKTVSDVKNGTKVTPKVKDGATIAKVEGDNFTYTITGHYADCVINTTNVNDGDTVTIKVTVAKPKFSMDTSDDGGYTLTYYTKADMSAASKITDPSKIVEGTDVYIEVTGGAIGNDRIPDTLTIDTKPVSKTSSGSFGPYTVNASVASTKIKATTAPKVLSIAVTAKYADETSANDKVVLQLNGGNVGLSIANVTKDGNPRVADLKIVATETGTTIKYIGGTGITDATGGKFTVDFSKFNNGDTVNIYVIVE